MSRPADPTSRSFTIQIYNPAKARHFAEVFDTVGRFTVGNRTALFEAMVSMLVEKIEAGVPTWAALNEVTEEYARRFLTSAWDRQKRVHPSARVRLDSRPAQLTPDQQD